MSVFTMIAVTAAVVFLTRMVVRIVEIKQSQTPDSNVEHFDERLRRLEKRMENIETILTAKDFHLKQAFADLEREQ